MRMTSAGFRLLICLFLVVLGAGMACADDAAAVMAPVHQFVDGFNKGDAKTALAACADQVIIIDEFPPYQWQGSCAIWASAYEADAKKNGITDGIVTLGKPKHLDISDNRAYVVFPASYAFKQNGKPVKETSSTFTLTLEKGSAGWQITGWAWSKQ
jgi:ketosteroid isomerase-like protein